MLPLHTARLLPLAQLQSMLKPNLNAECDGLHAAKSMGLALHWHSALTTPVVEGATQDS